MQELTTTANLVEYETLEDSGSIAAVLARSELEAALHADESAGVWFELGYGEDEETRQLTLELTSADVEEMLRLSPGDEVILALDADAVTGLFANSDVEAHGMRGALAIAVATAAIVAPTSLAATPESSSAAATAQVSSLAAKAQISSLAATTQVSRPAAKAQVKGLGAKAQVSRPAAKAQISSLAATTQVSRPAAKAQVKGLGAKAQVSKTLVVKAAGLKLLRGGLAQ